jgi:hypothetical protein
MRSFDPSQRVCARTIMIFFHMLCSLIICCLSDSQQKQIVINLKEKAANLRRNLVPKNAICRSVTRVIASGLCSKKTFDYKICTFTGYSTTTEIWIENGFERLENFDKRSCVSHVDAVCKSYVASSEARLISCSSLPSNILHNYGYVFVYLFDWVKFPHNVTAFADRRWKIPLAPT